MAIKTTLKNQGDDASERVEQLEIEVSILRDAYFQLEKVLVAYRKTEAELKKSEEKYRNLIATSLDIIQSVDPNGKFVFVNSVWQKVLGYSEEEAKNMDMFKIIDPDSLEHCKKIFTEVMSGKAIKDIEAVFVTKDGRKINIRGNAAPIIVDGKIVATHGFFRDVTERRKAELGLKLRTKELERMNALMVGRELRMVELKKTFRQAQAEMAKLKEKLGEQEVKTRQ